MSQHVIHLQENVIIAIIIASITIATVLEIDGSMKNVEIIAKYVYEVDCVLIEQVWNIWICEKMPKNKFVCNNGHVKWKLGYLLQLAIFEKMVSSIFLCQNFQQFQMYKLKLMEI